MQDESDCCFKMLCDGREYFIAPYHDVDFIYNEDRATIELIQMPKNRNWNILKILFLMIGCLLVPFLNIVFMNFPKFYDTVSPLLIRGKYVIKFNNLGEAIVLKPKKAVFDGNELIKPRIDVENGEIIPVEEKYDINHRDIKDCMFYCIYNICGLVVIGCVFVVLAILSINDIAAKIVIAVVLIPLFLVALITTIFSVVKKKTVLYKCLSENRYLH